MSRYTLKQCEQDLKEVNKNIVESLSPSFIYQSGRNGYHAIDLYFIQRNGRISCNNFMESGTPRELIDKAWNHAQVYSGYIPPSYSVNEKAKLSRVQCKIMAHLFGIDLDNDFHITNHWQKQYLTKLAKVSKYRKPKNANCSLANCFFNHLVKRVKVSISDKFSEAGVLLK